MSSAAPAPPLSSVAPPPTEVRKPENVRPENAAYVQNPMRKPEENPPVKPAESWFSSLFGSNPKPFTSVVPKGVAGGGRRRRSGKKTHRKKRAKKTRRRH